MNIWFKEIIINLNLLFNITFCLSLVIQFMIIMETDPNRLERYRDLFRIMFYTFWFSLLMVIFLPSEKAMNHMF